MEGNLNFVLNWRRSQFVWIWKTTLIFWKMEDDLNLLKRESDLIFFENGRQDQFYLFWRQPKFLLKWQMTSFLKIKDKLNCWSNGRRPRYSSEWKMTSKIKNKQCNLKQNKNNCYAVLKNSTVLLQATSTNTTTKKILAQINLNWLWNNSKLT